MTATAGPVLDIAGLTVDARAGDRVLPLVSGVDLRVDAGERVAVIGESGSGKTLTMLAAVGLADGLLDIGGTVRIAGSAMVDRGPDGRARPVSDRAATAVRRARVGMVFQEPLTALDPLMRVGRQVAEALGPMPRRERRAAVIDALAAVRLPDPASVATAYPHELSGGMRQRVGIAIALARNPALLICDEPTTALDVTVARGILSMIRDEVTARGMAVVLVSHDLRAVRFLCDRVVVMYGGRIVEAGPTAEVLAHPQHRYTAALLAASDLDRRDAAGRLAAIPGAVPAAGELPAGCPFRGRCTAEVDACGTPPVWRTTGSRGVACHRPVGLDTVMPEVGHG